ncbi:MAG: hypothetical protein ACF8AM_04535 [Rhodopirellula sp. JB055]|uniref:hypothetical protein n=1 Tax=Rhodopirellula sp. JB055 TaxID=3342846 RepID=UPI00370C8237
MALNSTVPSALASDPTNDAQETDLGFEELHFGTEEERSARPSADEISKIERYLTKLESDSAVVRRLTANRLYSQAINGNEEVRHAILSRLRCLRVSLSLDVRQTADQLNQRIRFATHQRAVQSLDRSPWDDLTKSIDQGMHRELHQWWRHFSERAGNDSDSIHQFQHVATLAGPDWQWNTAVHASAAVQRSECDQWTCLLGICVPDSGIRFIPASETLKRSLLGNNVHASDGHTAKDRVVGRLIDSTVRRNPYGWSMETRLAIGLTHRRTALVRELCEEIWNNSHARPREIALSLLAGDRVNHPACISHMNAFVGDRRVITVLPGQAHFGVGNAKWPRSVIVPRVGDVAQYLIWNAEGIDARKHGMSAIQADPVWGTRLESIGR